METLSVFGRVRRDEKKLAAAVGTGRILRDYIASGRRGGIPGTDEGARGNIRISLCVLGRGLSLFLLFSGMARGYVSFG